MNERELLAATKRGDEDSFARLVEPYRRELLAHCYRMLGSAHDAEDALQDALLDAWRGLPRFEGRSSLRSWLYTVTTNACLKAIRRRPKRVLPVDYGPPADPHDRPAEPVVESVWIEPYPDEQQRYEERESVELAFVASLQHLPPRQRAVLVLRDVLGFSARETAEMLDATPASVDSALQRAHKTVEAKLPPESQQAALRALDDETISGVVARYTEAWESGDVHGLVKLLTDDATFTMPPQREWFAGREAVAVFLARRPLAPENRWRLVPTHANGQLAFGHYAWDPAEGAFVAHAINVLTLRESQIKEITVFRMPELFSGFGLAETLNGG